MIQQTMNTKSKILLEIKIFQLKKSISMDENFFTKREYETQKGWIIELLVQQGTSLIDKHVSQFKEIPSDETFATIYKSPFFEDIKHVYRSILKWTDLTDEKVFILFLKMLVNSIIKIFIFNGSSRFQILSLNSIFIFS